MTQFAAAAPVVPAGPDAHGWYRGTGRRKTAVARVRLRTGSGKIEVNSKPFDEYFTEERDRKDVFMILDRTSLGGRIDIDVNAHGGGFTGQAGAVILGIGRALKNFDPNLEPILRDNGYLTRDDRKVERKKYGQSGARRRFQFSKR
ncbi:MAG TPA: 30S ribosomal protein S9 [Phycisphaerales bacterium]|nr:30S ribosomal protein S9 [Phycisphaerales bacterium]HMP38478.1 30S ribosomal protein S9 [Phycisphaerales bacterium]